MKKILNGFGAVLFLLVACISFFPQSVTYADHNVDDSGEWIDKVTILYNGAKYIDTNPYDSNRNHVAVRQIVQGADCGDMTVNGDGSGATVFYKTINSGGECLNHAPSGKGDSINDDGKHSFDISLTHNERWDITAYRLDDERIFMPVYYERHAGDGATGAFRYNEPRFDGTFYRYAPDISHCEDKLIDGNCAIFVQGDRLTNISGYSQWIDLTDNRQHADCGCSVDSHASWPITFANNGEFATPDPRAGYDVPAPGEEGEEEASEGEAPPSCESNNPNVILGWILCSVINFIDDSMQKLAGSVDGLLDIRQEEYDRDEYKAVWSYFKNIASFILVGVALVAIIGQALRGE